MFFEFYASLAICKPIFYEKSLKMYCFFSLSAMKLLVNHLFGSAFIKRCYRILCVFLANLQRFFSPFMPIFTVPFPSFPLTLQTLTTELMNFSVVKALLYSQTSFVNTLLCLVLLGHHHSLSKQTVGHLKSRSKSSVFI